MGFTLSNLFGGLVGLLDNSGVRQIADGPDAKALAAGRVMAQATHTLPGIIADEIAHGDPDRTEAQVIDDMDGRLWHNARPDITDYYVAELRNDPAYDGPLRDLIRQALAAAADAAAREADAAAEAAANPAPPAPGGAFQRAAGIEPPGGASLIAGGASLIASNTPQIAPVASQAAPETPPQSTEAVIVPPHIIPPHEDASGLALPPHGDAPQTFPQ